MPDISDIDILKSDPHIQKQSDIKNKTGFVNKEQLHSIIEIDPARCKPWSYHNRDRAWLTREYCFDLISSIQKNGQNHPVLVRKIKNDPQFDYELIYGVRRWFACSQIQGQKLLARITDADDKICMILMHTENADSKDISEFERAFSFAQQMQSGLFKNQSEMALAMGLSQGTISKMIKAAEIFDYDWVKALFKDKMNIPVKLAYELSSLLRRPQALDMIKNEANTLLKKQEKLGTFLSPSKILKRLLNYSKSQLITPSQSIILMANNKPAVFCRQDKFGNMAIVIEKRAKTLERSEVEQACIKALSDYLFK